MLFGKITEVLGEEGVGRTYWRGPWPSFLLSPTGHWCRTCSQQRSSWCTPCLLSAWESKRQTALKPCRIPVLNQKHFGRATKQLYWGMPRVLGTHLADGLCRCWCNCSPKISIGVSLFNYVVGDVNSSIIKRRLPGDHHELSVYLFEHHWSNRRRWSV